MVLVLRLSGRFQVALWLGSLFHAVSWIYGGSIISTNSNHYITHTPSVLPACIKIISESMFLYVIYTGTHLKKDAKSRVARCLLIVILCIANNYHSYMGCRMSDEIIQKDAPWGTETVTVT